MTQKHIQLLTSKEQARPVEEILEAFLDSRPVPRIDCLLPLLGLRCWSILSALVTIISLCQILPTTEHTPARLGPSLPINKTVGVCGIDPTPSVWAVPEEAASAAPVDTPFISYFS